MDLENPKNQEKLFRWTFVTILSLLHTLQGETNTSESVLRFLVFLTPDGIINMFEIFEQGRQ